MSKKMLAYIDRQKKQKQNSQWVQLNHLRI